MDRALIHFTLGREISVGIYLEQMGYYTPDLLHKAAPRLDPASPGRCVVGFCAVHQPLVTDLVAPPPVGWDGWGFEEWDAYFGWNNGTYLVDLPQMAVRQYHPVSIHRRGRTVRCDLSRTPRPLRVVVSNA